MMRERSRMTLGMCMRWFVVAAMCGAAGLAAPDAIAAPNSRATSAATEFSAQERRPPTRFRVYPGRRLLYRDCTFRLAPQWRPSGTVIVPVQHCWWVRG
jgi:hypothetical protein